MPPGVQAFSERVAILLTKRAAKKKQAVDL